MSDYSETEKIVFEAADKHGFKYIGDNGITAMFRHVASGGIVEVLSLPMLNQKTASLAVQKFENYALG